MKSDGQGCYWSKKGNKYNWISECSLKRNCMKSVFCAWTFFTETFAVPCRGDWGFTLLCKNLNFLESFWEYMHNDQSICTICCNMDKRSLVMRGTRWHNWLRHYATHRKVAGLIPDGVIGIFHWHNPFGHTKALGSTEPLTEIRTRNISWGVKAARA
jgi:hypothetical protein